MLNIAAWTLLKFSAADSPYHPAGRGGAGKSGCKGVKQRGRRAAA